jgi:hypothetical protein|tara:strand:+ start:463 stop:804 length:342 start_codon:yes stop_codon:yes gene_type:complete
MAFASGKYAIAICDRCGFEYKYTSLRKEWTGFRVCTECYEPKHPQLEPPRNVSDPQGLRFPRPSRAASSVAGEGVVRTIDDNKVMSVTGDPIGSTFSIDGATGSVGTVTVVTT